jgi:hypothetical protein
MVPQTMDAYDAMQSEAEVQRLIARGKEILPFADSIVKRTAKRATRKTFLGFDVAVTNSTFWKSEIGNELAADTDFAFVWDYDHGARIFQAHTHTLFTFTFCPLLCSGVSELSE